MAVAPIFERYGSERREIIASDINAFQKAINDQFLEFGMTTLNDPDTAQLVAGYEHLRLRDQNELISHASSGFITNNGWRFARVAIWYEDPRYAVGDSAYVSAANNACGTSDFNSGLTWCGDRSSMWARLETQDYYEVLLKGESARLKRTITKFYRRYSADQTFSDMADGASVTLADAVGYAGPPADCTGLFVLDGTIPLTCDDLFNHWNLPVTLNKINQNSIALTNRTGLIRNGQAVFLAEEARLE